MSLQVKATHCDTIVRMASLMGSLGSTTSYFFSMYRGKHSSPSLLIQFIKGPFLEANESRELQKGCYVPMQGRGKGRKSIVVSQHKEIRQ